MAVMLLPSACRRHTLVIEWTASEWERELDALATDQPCELRDVLERLEQESWRCDRVHVAVSAALPPATRHAIGQALCWWGCETVDVTYLAERDFRQALFFMPYIIRIANTASGRM